MEDCVWIWTDGGCQPNPGGPGGWGVVLIYGNHRRDACGHEPSSTNNRMELTAVIRALEMLRRPVIVRLHSDSRYVVDGATWAVGWQKNGWKTKAKTLVKNVDLWKRLLSLAAKHDITWVWVKGHSDDQYNREADKLALRGVQGQASDVRVVGNSRTELIGVRDRDRVRTTPKRRPKKRGGGSIRPLSSGVTRL